MERSTKLGETQGSYREEFRDGFIPFEGTQFKNSFEELKGTSPDLIFTHNRKDAHQDHRLIAELTWNTFRNQLILEYEIPKYDGDLGQPNLFVPLDQQLYQEKIRYIMHAFDTQRKALVREGDVLGSYAPAGHGARCFQRLCGGFLLPQAVL